MTVKRTTGVRRAVAGVATILAALLATALVSPQTAAGQQQTPGEAYAAQGFGIFMHYGLATFVGETPWNYEPEDHSATTYDPESFDAGQWMDAIKASRAKYIVLVTKHHDGFVMWPSETTDYGVESSSDPDTDVVGEVARAARDRGIEVALYYSWYDKLHPGGDVINEPPSAGYVEYAKDQIREILSNYGPISALWLDVPIHAKESGLAEFVHSVSPDTAFIWKYISRGQQLPHYPEADVRTYEGLSQRDRRVGQLGGTCDFGEPSEVAYNVSAGKGWWQMSDAAPPLVGAETAVAELNYTNALGGTLTLNVSPGPSGLMPPASVGLLQEIGTTAVLPYERLPDGRRAYDDGGGGTNRCGITDGIQYTGAWKGGQWDGALKSTRHFSRTAGEYAELSFHGTSVQVMAQTRPGHGIAAISVDGGEPELVDTYSDPPQERVIVWQSPELAPGEHTVRIEVTGEKNPASINTWIGLDAIVVTPECD